MPQTLQAGMLKDIVTGIAAILLIFAVALQLPLLGVLVSLLMPLPVLFYRSKLGRSPGAVVAIVPVAIIMGVVGAFTVDLLFFLELMLLGFILGELFEWNISVESIFLYAAGVVLGSCLIILLLYSGYSGMGLLAFMSNYVAQQLELTMAIYESMGVAEETLQILKDSLDQIQYGLVRILPALTAASTLVVTWSSIMLARPLYKMGRLRFPDFGKLNLWKAPEPLVWGVIICGLLLFLPIKPMKMLALNCLIVFMTIYFFQGIAIVSFFFEKKSFPTFLRICLYSLIALQQILLLVVIGVGFFDMWLNFRKLGQAQDGLP